MMTLIRLPAVVAAVSIAAASAACVTFEDRCVGVSCGDGEICVDLAAGPTCVCDDFHEESADGCVAVDDGGSG